LRHFFLALAFWASAAVAALGEDDAVRIGREANVEGLRALIEQHNPVLVYRATSAWNFGTWRELAAPLETLVTEHYADREIQRSLLSLLARQIDTFERYPKYRTRKLFDLLHADLKAGRDTLHYAIVIIATDLAVEADLAALLPQLDPAAANEIVMFLGHRRYAAALPQLQALQARVALDKNVNGMLERIDWAYLQIGTPEAMQALYARLRSLGQMKDERASSEVWHILLSVSQQPAGSPPPYAGLRAALPAEMNDSAWDQLIRLIEKRKETAGVIDLQRAITQSKRGEQAVDALLVVGTPDDWRIARQELERAQDKLSAGQIANLQRKLDGALADPAKFAGQRRQRERTEELYRAQGDYARERGRLSQIRKTEPKRYAAEMVPVLERWESSLATFGDVPSSVGAKQELAREYMQLGGVLRFDLRQPDAAIAAFEKARRVLPNEAFDLVSFAIADIQRFDKRDPRKALEAYRRALASLSSGAGRVGADARMLSAFKPWLESEIAYLEQGKRFSGALGREDLSAAYLWLGLAGMQAGAPLEPPVDSRSLAQLPPSQFQLARAYPAVLELEPKQMLGFFAKHDPAGYLTASVLSFTMLKEPSPYVKAAAETFFKERGIRSVALAMSKPDPRYSTPEKTWAAFIAAGRKGDVTAMLDCLAPEMQRRFGPLFKQMSREDLRKSADSFVGFGMTSSYGEFREAMVVRQQGEKKVAGAVTFVNDGGSWKIAEM
jgi:tetratricopeptide (TPR) repeat protein